MRIITAVMLMLMITTMTVTITLHENIVVSMEMSIATITIMMMMRSIRTKIERFIVAFGDLVLVNVNVLSKKRKKRL